MTHTPFSYNTSFLCTKSAEVGRGGGGGVLPLPINPPNFSLFFFLEAVTGFYGISAKKREIILTQNRKVCKGRRQDDITLLI